MKGFRISSLTPCFIKREVSPARRAVSIVLLAALLLATAFIPVLAGGDRASADAGSVTSAKFVIGLNQYFVNNQTPGVQMDAAPYIDAGSGRTLVPVRYLANALGIPDSGINWNQSIQTVTLTSGSTTISMVIGSKTLAVDGQTKTMDQAPVIKDGRTYLPARWVAEALGYAVDWDNVNKIVTIYPKNQNAPSTSKAILQAVAQANGKPAAVKKIEAALGVTMQLAYDQVWMYDPLHQGDSHTWARQPENMANSYPKVGYDASDGTLGIDICYDTMQPDRSKVNVDISPIKKVLEAFFPGDPEIPDAMAKLQANADVSKAHGGTALGTISNVTIGGKHACIGPSGGAYASIGIDGV